MRRSGDLGFNHDVAVGGIRIWADKMTALDDLFYCCLVGVWHRHNQFDLQAETAVVTRTEPYVRRP